MTIQYNPVKSDRKNWGCTAVIMMVCVETTRCIIIFGPISGKTSLCSELVAKNYIRTGRIFIRSSANRKNGCNKSWKRNNISKGTQCF